MSNFQGLMLACLVVNAVLTAMLLRDGDPWAMATLFGVAWCLFWLVTS